MSKMFDNYTKNFNNYLNFPCSVKQCSSSLENLKALYDKKQCFYGVEAKHQMPFSLYFHLTEATSQVLDSFMAECDVEISICSKVNEKAILTKVFAGKSIFNVTTQDIQIEISQEEAGLLKQETYGIILKLIHTTGTYIIHSLRDSVLVIR